MIEPSRFASQDYRPQDRLSLLIDAYAAVERVDIEVIGDGPPSFDVATLSLPGVTILQAAISPMSPRRTRSQASDGKDDMVLAFITNGTVRFEPQRGDELELKAGDAYLGYNTRASRHSLYDEPKFLDITIPRKVLAPLVKDLDAVTRGKIAPSPALALLKAYAETLIAQQAALSPELATLCANHLVDLAATALQPLPEAAEIANGRGLRHARLAAIRADIEANATEPWLTLEAMARRHGISPQYLRSLFYRDGTSFSDFVREKRLAHAYGMLTDPGLAHMRIGDIAYLSGFGDPSYFNSVFRRRYAMTPSDVRALAAERAKE